MINRSLIESSIFFFPVKTSHLLYIFLKHVTSFWWLALFFIDGFFIFSLGSVICKKYTKAKCKDSKNTNSIDISIIWSCGMERVEYGVMVEYGVGPPVEEYVKSLDLSAGEGVGSWLSTSIFFF